MNENIRVKKHSGDTEQYSPSKLYRSLERAGADKQTVEQILYELEAKVFDGITTTQIYKLAFQLLRKIERSTASRYSLRKAIMELGPSGFPFEQLVGALINSLGYQTQVGIMVKGKCVGHELDVVARNKHEMFMVECKFYNSQGKNCNVQVPLYINSRFNDVKQTWENDPANKGLKMTGWVVTNTRFTADATDYGKCAGLTMISWDYPHGNSLRELVEKSGLYPVTVLTSLSRKQKEFLLGNNVVLCSHLLQKPEAFGRLGLDIARQEKVLKEAASLCSRL